jgi:hypothetical protein
MINLQGALDTSVGAGIISHRYPTSPRSIP